MPISKDDELKPKQVYPETLPASVDPNLVQSALRNTAPPVVDGPEVQAYRNFGVTPEEDMSYSVEAPNASYLPTEELQRWQNQVPSPVAVDQDLGLSPHEFYAEAIKSLGNVQHPTLEKAPIPSRGTSVRRALESMIPIVGPALVAPEIAREKELGLEVTLRNKARYEIWDEQQKMARAALTDEYKRRVTLDAVQRGERFFAARYPNASPQQWRHWAMDYAGMSDTGYKEPNFEPVYVQLADAPDRFVLAQANRADGTYTFRHPITQQKTTYGPAGVTGEIDPRQMWGRSMEEQQWEAARREKWAYYNARNEQGWVPRPAEYKPTALDIARAEKYWEEQKTLAPHYTTREDGTVVAVDRTGKSSTVIGPDGKPLKAHLPTEPALSIQAIEVGGKQVLVAFDPRHPEKGGVPLTLPGGGPAVRKGELTTQTKGKVDQAWAIDMTGRDLMQQVSDPAVIRELGAIAGRVTDMEARLGTISPKARHLYTTLKSFYALQGLLHGWRAIRVSQEFEEAIGGLKQSPQALAAGIQSIQDTARIFLEMGQGAGYIPAGGNVDYLPDKDNPGQYAWYQRGEDGKWHKQAPR